MLVLSDSECQAGLINFDKAAGHASSPRQEKEKKKKKRKKKKKKEKTVLMKFESKEQVIGSAF